jgi:hypothetical protein
VDDWKAAEALFGGQSGLSFPPARRLLRLVAVVVVVVVAVIVIAVAVAVLALVPLPPAPRRGLVPPAGHLKAHHGSQVPG